MQVLNPGGLMITYGPYAHDGVIEPQSNVVFDKHLRDQNKKWGLRDISDLQKLAHEFGMQLEHKYDLPANNKCLVWKNVGKSRK